MSNINDFRILRTTEKEGSLSRTELEAKWTNAKFFK